MKPALRLSRLATSSVSIPQEKQKNFNFPIEGRLSLVIRGASNRSRRLPLGWMDQETGGGVFPFFLVTAFGYLRIQMWWDSQS